MKNRFPTPHTLLAQAFAVPLAVVTACVFAHPAHAATKTWDGGGTSDNWTTGGNWDANTAPLANDILVFDQNFRLGPTNDFTANTQFNGLTFATSAGAFALSGNSITLGGNITNNSRNAQTVANALTLGVVPTINVSTGTGSLALSGVISGSHGITKTGSGLLNLTTATNTFTGTVTVNGGTLQIDNNARLGNTNNQIVLDGGTLRTLTGATINAGHLIKVGNAGGGSGTLDLTNAVTLSSTVVISDNGGAGSLVKTGAGTLTLNSVATYTGSTTINHGALSVDQNGGGGVNSASALIMGGDSTTLNNISVNNNTPSLLVQGGAAVTTQTFAGTTLNQGNSNVSFRSIGAAADTVALGAITHNGGGLVNFTRVKDASGSANALITTSNSNTNGILGGWAVTNADAVVAANSNSQAATDWATVSGGAIVAYSGYTIPTGAAPTLANDATSNVRISNASTGNIGLTFSSNVSDLNTIQMTDTVSRTITVGSGNTLRLGSSGGVWKTNGVNNTPLTIGASVATGGTLTAGGAANTAGEIVFNSNSGSAGNNGIIVNSLIANNGTGVVSLTKTGVGSMDLLGANTYTGNTYVNQGRFAASNLSVGSIGGNGTTAGSGTVYIQPSGQLFLAEGATRTVANNVVVAGSGTNENGSFGAIRFGNNTTLGTSTSTITLVGDTRFGRNSDTATATIAGQLTGNFNLELTAGGQNTEATRNVFVFSNTTNNMGGNLGINAINLGAGQTANNNGNTSVQLRLGASEVIANGAGKGNVFIGGSATALNNTYLDLNGFNETINGLQSAGTNFAQQRVTNGRSGTPSVATLTVGDGNATATFGGIIENGTGTTALTKIGTGTQTLSGANTYMGATTVSAGTLSVTGSLANSAVSVSSGATLAGTGTIGGAITSSGILAPGISGAIATLTASNGLSLNTGASFKFDLTNAANTSDLVAITGVFSNAGTGPFNFDFNGTGTEGNVYTLLTFTSQTGFLVSDFSYSNVGAGAGFFTLNAGSLQFTAVPEPHQYALLISGLIFVVIVLRRRRAVSGS